MTTLDWIIPGVMTLITIATLIRSPRLRVITYEVFRHPLVTSTVIEYEDGTIEVKRNS